MKIKIENKYIKSLKFRILVIILIFSLAPMYFLKETLVNTTQESLLDSKIERIKNQTLILKNHIASADYISGTEDEIIDAELSQLSSMFDARLVIIDKNYKIIKDTYQMDIGKYSISEPIIKSFKGLDTYAYDAMNSYVQIIVRIPTISDKNAANGVLFATFSTKDIEVTMEEIENTSWIFLLIIYTVVIALSVFISIKLVTPFKKLETSLENMANGHLDELLDIKGYTETDRISTSFNHMIEKMNKLDESRQEFVSNVSHELKTPITSIKVLADSLLMQDDAPVEIYKEFMADIVDEIDRENKIITDLLALVKLDKTTADMNITQVNINEMLELILKRLKPIAAIRNIELLFESFRPVIAEVDEVKFTIALSNLIENAVKYNILDGWVRVSLNSDHKYMYIKIADSGVGIPEEEQEQVYERFYRVDKTRSRETGGTGLGLSITKNVIAMHKGAIKLYSKEGEGTTFTVRVPLNFTN